jgi:hypothetical protein
MLSTVCVERLTTLSAWFAGRGWPVRCSTHSDSRQRLSRSLKGLDAPHRMLSRLAAA